MTHCLDDPTGYEGLLSLGTVNIGNLDFVDKLSEALVARVIV